MKVRKNSSNVFWIFLITLIILLSYATPSKSQTGELSRELEIGVYDDYVEIMSYTTIDANETTHATELEIRLDTEGGEGPITMELEYWGETEMAGGGTENALTFTLTLNKFIEYNDTTGDGIYSRGSDTVVQQVLLGDRGIVMYDNPSAKQISIGGNEGYQISVNGTIPKGPDTIYFRIIGFIFENPVILNDRSINPTEFKIDLEIEGFPFTSPEYDLALETILTTSFEVEYESGESSSYTWVASDSIKGYFGWINDAIVDGVNKPVTASSSNIWGETFTYLCYKNGALIVHDPTLAIYPPDDSSGKLLIPLIIVSIFIISIISGSIVLSKQEYRDYLLTRILHIDSGRHRLSMKQVLENENRSKIIDIILKEPGIHFNELLNQANISAGTLVWHLDVLETYKVIKKRRFGQYLIFYSYLEKNPLSIIDLKLQKSRTTFKILQLIRHNPGLYQNQIAKTLDLNHKTVKYHLEKLIELELIYAKKRKRRREFYSFDKSLEVEDD